MLMPPHRPKHFCRNPRCRMKLSAPVENEHHAFCCRGCHAGFYRLRCRVCERPLAADPMTGARRTVEGRKYCGRKCAYTARSNPRTYRGLPPHKSDARSAHFTGLKVSPAPIRASAHVLAVEVWGGSDWQPAVSSGGVPIEVAKIRPRGLVH
jgi:hypothetical protein